MRSMELEVGKVANRNPGLCIFGLGTLIFIDPPAVVALLIISPQPMKV